VAAFPVVLLAIAVPLGGSIVQTLPPESTHTWADEPKAKNPQVTLPAAGVAGVLVVRPVTL